MSKWRRTVPGVVVSSRQHAFLLPGVTSSAPKHGQQPDYSVILPEIHPTSSR